MQAVTDQPDVPQEGGGPDPSYGGSGWLAKALSGTNRSREVPADGAPPLAVPPLAEQAGVPASDEPASDERTTQLPETRESADQADAPASHGAGSLAEQLRTRSGRHAHEPQEALSPLGAPPMPATPIGVVRWWTAGATLAAGVLLSVAAYAGVGALAAAAVLVVAVLAWGWPMLVDLPSPRGSSTVVGVGGAACVASVALSREEPLLQWLALALAGAVVLEFVHQLARRDGRPRLVECVTGTLAGVVVLASMSSWLALPRTEVQAGGVLLVAVPVAVGLAVQALPLPARLAGVAGVVAAALLAGLVAGLLPQPTVLSGLVTGLAAGTVAVMLHLLLAVLPPAGSPPAWLSLALAPLASTGMVSYVVLRLMVG